MGMIPISIQLSIGRSLTVAARNGPALARAMVVFAALTVFGGCADQTREVGKRVRELEVKTVVDKGLTLDQGAEAAAVVYVLLGVVPDA